MTIRYVTAKPCCVSKLCIRVHEPSMAEWSCRRCTSFAFRRISISPTLHRHLSLAIASRGAPRGVGSQAVLFALGPINRDLPTVLHVYVLLLVFF
jgi:hypothetical protein